MEAKNYRQFISVLTVIIFALIYIFLISRFCWNLIFLDTIASGGDMGTHNYSAFYSFKIFPKLKWWSPDWTAGFPFLYFYPPFFFYLISFFSHFTPIPINILFKLSTLVGTFFFPLALFLCLKILDFKFPIPQIGAVFSLFYLFLEKFSIYGGNIPSTLAGEFSFSFAFGLFFIFISLLIKAQEEKKLISLTIFTLVLMVITHPIPVVVSVVFALIMFLEKAIFEKKFKKIFFYLLYVFGFAFFITAFWSLPFLVFHLGGYTAKMQWYRSVKIDEIFPPSFWPFYIFLIIGIFWFIFRFKKENKNLGWLLGIMFASSPLYLGLNNSSVFNCRFLPFIIVSYLLISAYGLGSLLNFLFSKIKINYQQLIKGSLLIILNIFLIYFYLPKTISYIPSWLKWNYEGFEKKATWPEISPLFDYLKSLPYGRIMVEYRPEYDKFGTPRVFENLPIFANKPTFEGLLTESSLNSYFHFINQTETTRRPSAAIAGFDYPPFNFENGVRHLQLFGAKYFLAYTSEIKNLANQNKYLKKLKDINDFSVYQIENSPLVEPIKEIELKPKTKKWLDESIDWYKKMDFSKFIVFYQSAKEKKTIKEVLNKKTEPLNNSVEIDSLTNDSLSFKTENLFLPHLVKISYFPGWKVQGAYGPYLISPSFIMVIPFKNQVTLKYHYNFWDKIGMILSFLGIIFLVLNVFFRKFIDSLKKKRPFHFLSNY